MRYFFLLSCVLLASCNNNSSTTSNAQDTTPTSTIQADTGTIANQATSTTCYAYQSANDTVKLNLTATGLDVSGKLLYAYSGKDRNSGVISGTMKGDTLLADYTFMSEGRSSVRQVAFLRKGDGFVEGYGDVRMESGKMIFTNTEAIKFGSTMALRKTACDSL